MSESQRRRITFGIIFTIIGAVWSAAGLGVALRVQSTLIWAILGIIILLSGIGLIARFLIIRARSQV